VSRGGRVATRRIQSLTVGALCSCRDIASNTLLLDKLKWCKFSSLAWTKDNRGFFYSRYDAPSSQGKEDGAGTEVEASASQKVGV
jgi:hypothetical protein